MTHRNVLPNRRPSITMQTSWAGHSITVTVGLDPVTGEPMEVFGDMDKGGDLAAVCRDGSIGVSLAVQYGAAPEVIDKAMARVPVSVIAEDGTIQERLAYASPVGAIVGALVGVGD